MDPLLRDAFVLDWVCRAAQVAKRCVNPDPLKKSMAEEQ
jgi:hypothetical protein